MTSRARTAVVALLAALGGAAVLAVGAQAQTKPAPATPATPAPVASSTELFPLVPLDPKVRVYLCGGELVGTLEIWFGKAERIRGEDGWVLLELLGRTYAGAVPRTLGREWLKRDEHGILCARREEGSVATDLDPPQRFLDLPLEIGKRWTWKGSASGLDCESESVVVAREKLTLPYGEIEDAWRIDTVMTGRARDRLERSMWVAPGLGLVQETSRISCDSRPQTVSARLQALVDRQELLGKPRDRRH